MPDEISLDGLVAGDAGVFYGPPDVNTIGKPLIGGYNRREGDYT
jgi:hypothetical protein